jgi:DNA-binding NarL/FixJ family response regulator
VFEKRYEKGIDRYEDGIRSGMHPDPGGVRVSQGGVVSERGDSGGGTATARSAGRRVVVVIADPDPLARRAIRASLEDDGGFRVSAEAADGREAIRLAARCRPDVLLMEIALPSIDGISAAREIAARTPEVRIVMFSVPQEHELQVRALRAGAVGFLSKDASIESILRSLRSVAEGEVAFTRALTSHLVELVRANSENGIGMRPVKSPLTTREWEVLDLLCAGASTREISAELCLSESTIYTHAKTILRKLGVHSRTDAIKAAAQMRRQPSRLT